ESVETDLKGTHPTPSHLPAQPIPPLDFRSHRLRHHLHHFRTPPYRHKIEPKRNEARVRPSDTSRYGIRCHPTPASADHKATEEGLVQFGHSKDDPTRPQIKVMIGSLGPLGMPLATDVVSGERADDGLSLPIIERLRTGLQPPGLLFVGDCKMSALDTRAYLARHQDWYLSPLPLTGATAQAMDTWITTGVRKDEAGELERIGRTNDRGYEGLAAEGYELERTCCAPDSGMKWRERVLVVRSPLH